MSYTSFSHLLHSLDGYIDELAPYTVDASQTMFPTLPLELRELIYGYVLPAHLRSLNPLRNVLGMLLYNTDYALFSVSRGTCLDVGLWYLRTREFELGRHESCAFFAGYVLEWFPGEQGFLAVRHLEISRSWASAHPGTTIAFVLRCAEVRTLKLWFENMSLRERASGVRASAQDIADGCGLARLFGLEKIQRIELKWYRMWDLEGYGPVYHYDNWWAAQQHELQGMGDESLSRMEELREWFNSGFEAVGKSVVVDLVPV